MPRKVFVHPVNKTIRIRPNSESVASGETLIGTSDHIDVAVNADDSVGNNLSHVLYHHIQELMIKAGRLDYDQYRILNVVPITGVNAGNDITVTVAAGPNKTKQLAPVVLPTDTTEPQAVTYASSVPAKATVSVGGLVTGVETGSTVITVTNTSSGLTDTLTVTVTA